MMDYTNLQVLAEVSVTLLGFSGITAVIGQSRFDQLGVGYRMQLLLYTSSAAFVGSILPLVGIPILLATIGMAVSMTTLTVWTSRNFFGWFQQKVQMSLALVWIFLPLFIILTLYLWWSIFTLAEQLLFIYELSIGSFLLLATVAFVRLVRSVFVAEDMSSKN
jgi:hypothetical protein